jgi:leader peptidase (prepilin peptidase)/N-methyltransferase
VELVTGLLFFAGVAGLGPTLAAFKFCVFATILVALVFMDFEERILADEFTLGGTAAGIALAWLVPLPPAFIVFFLPLETDPHLASVAESVFAAFAVSGMLWLMGEMYRRVRGREGLGFGDVKMVACMGAFLGLGSTLMALIIGSVVGSVTGILYIWLHRKDAATYELPFGSFLGIAGLAVVVWEVWK